MENIGDSTYLHKISLDSIYYESAIVYSMQNTNVSGFSIDAAIELFDYDSYVRLILVDEDPETEYLVFDAYYPKNKIDTMFCIRQYAQETTSLFNITTSYLKIEVRNAVCAIESIYYSDKYNNKTPKQFHADRMLNKAIQDSTILDRINHRLRQENKLWVAGNTSLLQMFYDDRKAVLPKNENNEIPNLQGLEYYIGGQGYLELKNGATIENAVCAVELWHPGDWNSTGGIVMGMDSDHGYQTIHAKVPFAEMDRYSTTLSSLTSGRGTFTMKYAEYAQVPTDVQQRLLKEYEESQKEEE